MIPTIKLTPKRAIVSATGSKGCQPKWFENNIWYKADSIGYESFAEVASSSIMCDWAELPSIISRLTT